MSQKTKGWQSALSLPGVYNLCQNILGGRRSRNELVKKYIRPKQGFRILDLGCGPANILEYLPKNLHYVGIDLSQDYIKAAQEKYSSRGEFHCMPLENLRSAGISDFDLVMGLGVLHHLDDEQANIFFNIASTSLNEYGRCLTVDPCLVQKQHFFSRILIQMDRGQNVRMEKEYGLLASKTFPRIHQEICHDRLRIPYTQIIMECWK